MARRTGAAAPGSPDASTFPPGGSDSAIPMAERDPSLPKDVRDLGGGFWNLRGSLKLAPLIDIGTQASMVRLTDGRFVMLDAIDLTPPTRAWVDQVTRGKGPAAICHLHPFHTLHVRRSHEAFPEATLYGTARHHRRFPDLPWAEERTEDPAFAERFGADFAFTVPQGVAFIPDNQHLHFASVLALHRASGALHVDDTLVYLKLPGPLGWIRRDVLRFHPTLGQVLERRPGAAEAFRGWADELVGLCREARSLCAAHAGILREATDPGPPIDRRVEKALRKVQPLLDRHARAHG